MDGLRQFSVDGLHLAIRWSIGTIVEFATHAMSGASLFGGPLQVHKTSQTDLFFTIEILSVPLNVSRSKVPTCLAETSFQGPQPRVKPWSPGLAEESSKPKQPVSRSVWSI